MPELVGLLLAMAGSAVFLALLADRRYRQLPVLPLVALPDALPPLSILIPARNEARNLARLLPSLLGAAYPGELEVIVIDDGSTDATSRVAQDSGAQVLNLNHLPAGWLGKPYACHRGAAEAHGEWLLFTDADTFHHPQGPAAAVAYALGNRLDGVSAFLRQETHGLWDQLPLLTIFAGLFAGLSARRPMLNGQYILLRQEVYEASGGFAAVRSEPLEDLALGRHLNKLGYQTPVVSGEDAASVRMYHNLSQLWQGLSRLGAGALRRSEFGSWIMVLCITLAMSPLWMGLLLFVFGQDTIWILPAWLLVAAGFAPWARRMGSGWAAFLAPVGALVVQAAGTWGLLRRLLGFGFVWKGRRVSQSLSK
jgi:chlorobactene glucosyltransferase